MARPNAPLLGFAESMFFIFNQFTQYLGNLPVACPVLRYQAADSEVRRAVGAGFQVSEE